MFPVLHHFKLSSPPIDVKRFGEGHIHDTYLVETEQHDPDYILQKINSNIFKDIPGMMKNIELATNHMRKKLSAMPDLDPARGALSLVMCKEGTSFFTDGSGGSWRMYVFIQGTTTFQVLPYPELAAEAGKNIALFQSMLSDLDAPLIETIPHFHDIILRISQYEKAKLKDPAGRSSTIPGDLHFVESRFERMSAYFRSLQDKAKLRATHNDTKLNNILFDDNYRALCIVDLDTVMPGYVHFDFGDALRTLANTAVEDEKDLSEVHFSKSVYDHFSEGYLAVAGSFLEKEEIELLPFSPIYMTFIIGLRFLTDYLNGDVYFRTHRQGHNLERARVQFRLAEEMEDSLICRI